MLPSLLMFCTSVFVDVVAMVAPTCLRKACPAPCIDGKHDIRQAEQVLVAPSRLISSASSSAVSNVCCLPVRYNLI